MAEGKLAIDFSKKSGGAVGELPCEVVEKGIMFPDGSVWEHKFCRKMKAKPHVWCEGYFIDGHHPEGWRTIVCTGPCKVCVAGMDDKEGDVWCMEGTLDPVANCIGLDFTKKSNGAVGVLTAKPCPEGIEFPDGSKWTKFDPSTSSAAVFLGAYIDGHHPEGWRTIAACGPEEAMVAGVDDKDGAPWCTKGEGDNPGHLLHMNVLPVNRFRVSLETR